MKCPHCLDNFHDEEAHKYIGQDVDGTWSISSRNCASCNRLILFLVLSNRWHGNAQQPIEIRTQRLIRPPGTSRPPCPSQVHGHIAEDYSEACIVLPDSAKASAALSRRCLQNLLREKAGVKHGNLAEEIQEVINRSDQ